MLGLMAARNPKLNGLWTIEGLPYPQTKEYTYDDEGEINGTQIVGDIIYPFDLDMHIGHSPDDVIWNEDGSFTLESVTEFRALHGFAGWTLPTAY